MAEPYDDEVDALIREPGRRGRRARVIAGIVAATGLLALGAIGGAVLTERRHNGPAPAASAGTDTTAASPATDHSAHGTGPALAAPPSDEPIEVTLGPDAVQRAGIKVSSVQARAVRSALTVPGTVSSNAYRDTKVSALVGGIVRQVGAELGSPVRRGETMAVIFSSELADAQMKYLSVQAMLHADQQKLDRTRKLVDIGAASRQELDDATAVRSARATELAAARQRLLLLGLSSEQVARITDAAHIVSEVTVPAPSDGVVIARTVNTGQVVGGGQELFVVTDLGTVWVIGDLYEKDFGAVRVGTPAAVIVPAASGRAISGRVAYIDPRVEPATRTAKVRIEVPNRDGALRLGMFVEVTFETGAAGARTTVPRTALQSVGSRSVVYVATEDEGRFVERAVRVGTGDREAVEVLEGLKPGERVVSEGSFYVRAEAGRARGGG